MTSPYTPRPALQIDSGYLVFHSVQKRFPAFLRCHALHYRSETEFVHAGLTASPVEFRNAVTKLPPTPILGPIAGGVPLIFYLAARGLEEDFKDLADEIQEEGLQRLHDIPDPAAPILVIYGDPQALDSQARSAPVTEAASPPVAVLPSSEPSSDPQPEPPPAAQTDPEPAPPPAAAAEAQSEPAPAPEPEPVPAPPASPRDEVLPVSNLQPPSEAAVPQPLLLALGSDYYALRGADTGGTTVVVWHARRLPAPPAAGAYEILQPTASAYERLIADARGGVRYADDEAGELVAIKIALRGSEPDLARAFNVLKRIGPRALRLYYPSPTVEGAGWSPDFPCCVAEWVSGNTITHSPAFSEPVGLDLCLQVLDLVAAARQAAPDVVLTDSLAPSNIIVAYDERGAARARLIDWNVYAAHGDEAARAMLRTLGVMMVDLFADLPAAAVASAGAESAGRAPVAAWDSLSFLTRSLIHRLLNDEFENDIDLAVVEIKTLLGEQRARWADNDPMWQARLAGEGAARLNWLDIAAAKQTGLTDEARARLADSRANEVTGVIAGLARERRYAAAVGELRVAVRRHPDQPYFRWALLANTVAALSPEGASDRLRLDEALSQMRSGDYARARQVLEQGLKFFDEVPFESEKRERARDAALALSMCAECLAVADSALAALGERWNVEEAESSLALAEARLARHEQLSKGLLAGRDPLCQQKLAALRDGIQAFYERHGRYDPQAARRETAEQTRRAGFTALLERGSTLAGLDRPDAWSAAGVVFDRAASDYPDLWTADHDRQRLDALEKIARHRLDEGRRALSAGRWDEAGTALAAAMLTPATLGEAARLQSALWAYLRGEVELKRGEPAAALASFTFAADHSPEIRHAAEAQIQPLRDSGAAAGGLGQAGELERRFAEQQGALNGAVHSALIAAQDGMTQKQIEALKRAQAEESTALTAAIQKQQDDQVARFQSTLTEFQRQFARQQEGALQKSQEDQSGQLRALLIRMYDEHAEGLRQTLVDFQKEQSARLKALEEAGEPGWFAAAQRETRKTQDEQALKLQAALKSLEDTAAWLRAQAVAKAEAPAPEAAEPEVEGTVRELGWKVEGNTTALKTVQSRIGQLMGLNLVLLLGLLGMLLCAGAYMLIPSLRAIQVGLVDVATATALPGTQTVLVEPSVVTATPGQAFDQTLACAGAEQPRAYYECTVTNTGDAPLSLALVITPGGLTTNGFFSAVRVGSVDVTPVIDQEAPSRPARFAIGDFGQGDSRRVRVSFSCTAANGCQPTTFTLTVVASDDSQEPDSGNSVSVTTYYPPP